MYSIKTDRICGVCGDKAIAKNFCAYSCESCKAFFRRNASKVEQMKCIFGDECDISIDTRKRCRKCRLKKCYSIGMRKEWILNEIEKRERNEKRVEKRKQRNEKMKPKESSSSQSSGSSDDNMLPLSESNTSSDNTTDDIILILTLDNIDFETNSIDFETNDEIMIGEDLSSGFVGSHCSDENHVPEYTELVPISRPLRDYDNPFNELESTRLKELLEASKFLIVTCDPSKISSQITKLSEALGLISMKWEQEVRKMIKTAKTLSAFKNICEDDKLTLLKSGSLEITFMRSISCYDRESENWCIGLDEKPSDSTSVAVDVFKQLRVEKYEQYRSFSNKLAKEWDLDFVILYLLSAIVLFNPNRPKLIHRSFVRLQQQVYIHLLKRYLQLKYRSESVVKAKFSRFIDILSDLYSVHEMHIKSVIEKEPLFAIPFISRSPLLKELYDQ